MSLWKSSPLAGLPRIRNVRTKRVSSWDRSGGNDDRLHIMPGETAVLADIKGAGCVNHFWCTLVCGQPDFLRRIVLRMRWDNESDYSVEVPIGDFFGVGHAQMAMYASLPLQMGPTEGRAFSCFFPMPYSERALIEVTSECDMEVIFYYFVDYEIHEGIDADLGRFHAQWRRENPTDGIPEEGLSNQEWMNGGKNIGGKGNYTILEAEGQGHYVGCNLNIHNLRAGAKERWPEELGWPLKWDDVGKHRDLFLDTFDWIGEGDDMIFIDGDEWPPSLHGTGLEDYFNCSWCPFVPYSAPYHGITIGPDGPNWAGKMSFYRFHIEDPVHFQKSIRVTIEHGHANHRSDDYSSTAYWYQLEPHKAFPLLLPVGSRLPRRDG
jgi:hypothetical protein